MQYLCCFLLIIFLFYKTPYTGNNLENEGFVWACDSRGIRVHLSWRLTSGTTSRKQREKTGRVWDLKFSEPVLVVNVFQQGHTFQTRPATGYQVFKYLRWWSTFTVQGTTYSFIYLLAYFRNRQDGYKIADIVIHYYIMELCSKKCIVRQPCHRINHKTYFHKLRGLHH